MAQPEGWRLELIDGELHVSRQPYLDHQYVTNRLVRAFDRWDADDREGFLFPAPGIIFSREEAVATALACIAGERLARVAGPDGTLHAAPAIKILSPGRENERRSRDL